MAMAGLMWMVFETFGYSNRNFFIIIIVLLPLSLLFGYILSKVALEPLFITNNLLDRLLKDTLHELNIPLSTVFANVKMLKKDEKDSKKLARLERIEKAGENLGELYEDLDYFIKKEIGNVERESFDLDEIVKYSIAKMDEMADGISIQYKPLKIRVTADRRGCQKTIDNLLANAIKYNHKGGTVEIYGIGSSVIIKDSGVGMDETTLFHIFDRYYQSDLSASGYGIGLHIVKTFCDEHGIDIKIDSKKGEGTVFCLNFASIGERY